MPLSTETAAFLTARRTRLIELLTLPLSRNEIEEVMGVPLGTVANDINVLRRSNSMPERPADMSYTAKLRLYHHALKNELTPENGYHCHFAPDQDAEKKSLIAVLRGSLDIRDAVKSINLMLQGVAMQRMPKLPRELWRTATIWRLAVHGYRIENGIDHDHGFWHSRMVPAPHVATFTVESFEKRIAPFNVKTNVFTANGVEEFAERFVAFLEFRAEPSNGLVMVPTNTWDQNLVQTDLVITATTRNLIEAIIAEHCTPDVASMLNMLAPQNGDPGMTIEEIGQEMSLTRERVRQRLRNAIQLIRAQLRKALHLEAMVHSIDVTDTAHVQRIKELEELREQLRIARTQLAERTKLLVYHRLLPQEDAPPEDIDGISEETVAHLCKRVDALELSIRSENCLMNANLKFVWQVAERTEVELFKTKNFGRKSLNEIKEVLKDLGLSLGMKIPASVRARLPA